MRKKEDILVKNYNEGKFRVAYAHTPGKWYVIHAGSREQARAVARAKEKIFAGESAVENLLFGKFAQDFFNPQGEWAQLLHKKGRRPYGGYYKRLNNDLVHYILPRWGATPMNLIEPVMIDEWLSELKSYRHGRELAPRSKNQVMSAMKHIFEYAKYKGVIERNPIDYIKQFHGEGVRAVFSPQEIQAMFPIDENELRHIWPNLTHICFFLILRDAGLRPGEALALDWANYSDQFKCFAIVQKFEQSTNRILPGTKTGVSRAVPITGRTAKYLAQLKKQQGKDEGLIFSKNGIKPFSENSVVDRLNDAMARAGIPRFVNGQGRTPYSFRHAFVTNALSANLHPDEVALLAGHSRQVQKGYNHPTNDHLFNRIKHLRDQVERLYH